MLKYIVRDLTSVCCYLPYGLVVGILVVIILSAINDYRVKKGKEPFSVVAITAFVMYAAIMLIITFLSRESGSPNEIDMQILSTWGINTRNNAYLIENIMFFIPYGFLCAWVIKAARKWFTCTFIGALTSFGIECLQLVSGRGFFQIDDILTNIAGASIGWVVFRCVTLRKRK